MFVKCIRNKDFFFLFGTESRKERILSATRLVGVLLQTINYFGEQTSGVGLVH